MLKAVSRRPTHLPAALMRAAAIFCVIAVLALAAIQAVHSHAQETPEHSKHCSLCPSVAPAVLPTQTATVSAISEISGVIVRPADSRSKDHQETYSLFIRPPPLA